MAESILGNEDFTGTNIDKKKKHVSYHGMLVSVRMDKEQKCINNSGKFYGGIFIKEGGMWNL